MAFLLPWIKASFTNMSSCSAVSFQLLHLGGRPPSRRWVLEQRPDRRGRQRGGRRATGGRRRGSGARAGRGQQQAEGPGEDVGREDAEDEEDVVPAGALDVGVAAAGAGHQRPRVRLHVPSRQRRLPLLLPLHLRRAFLERELAAAGVAADPAVRRHGHAHVVLHLVPERLVEVHHRGFRRLRQGTCSEWISNGNEQN
jgi:hypothetical protein